MSTYASCAQSHEIFILEQVRVLDNVIDHDGGPDSPGKKTPKTRFLIHVLPSKREVCFHLGLPSERVQIICGALRNQLYLEKFYAYSLTLLDK